MTLLIVISSGVLAAQPELRLAVPLLVGITAFLVVGVTFIVFFGERNGILCSPAFILGVALVLRLMFLFAPPQLSDDIFRYLWDGQQVVNGANPYAVAPADVLPPPDLEDVHSRINHPKLITIYPPSAQLVFAGGSLIGGGTTGLKAFLVLFDMGLCALLIQALSQLGMPSWRVVLYAWNPLPIVEIAGSGHVDGSGLTMVLAAICLLMNEKNNRSETGTRLWPFLLAGALLACAGLVKLFPFALAPLVLFLAPPKKRKFCILGFLGAFTALLLPFLPQLTNLATTLDVYARNWEFAGFAFSTMRKLTGSGEFARTLLLGIFVIFAAWTYRGLAGHFAVKTSRADSRYLVFEACYTLSMAMLLLTPTLLPWYAINLSVFLPFCAGPAGIVLCWAVFLTYQVQIPYFILGQWIEDPRVTAAVFVSTVLAYVLSRISLSYRRLSR